MGRAAQGGPGAAACSTCPARWATRPTRRRRRPSSTWPSRPPIEALDQFKDEDEVGLRVFTTDLGRTRTRATTSTSCRSGRSAHNRERARAADPRPRSRCNGTPLYDVTADVVRRRCSTTYDPTPDQRRRAADRRPQRGRRPGDDDDQLDDAARRACGAGSEGENAKPVRVFPIAYGERRRPRDAAPIAEATNARRLRRQRPPTINKVFTAVVSNF